MSEKPISRRNFLKVGAIALGASSVACCGLSYAAMEISPTAEKPQVETPSFIFGKDHLMNQRILVAYATRTGSTVGVAASIGETLAGRDFTVDVKPLNENPNPGEYQAVVIGSAINGGQWLPEAVEYVKNHQQALQMTPAALFCVHIMNTGDDEKSCKNRMAYLNKLRSLLQPVDEAYFAGVGMDPDEQSAIIRWVYRTFKIGSEGDCRDWTKIRGWAQTLFVKEKIS